MAEPWSDGDVLTAAHLAGLPWGVMGYVNGSASAQTGITTDVDITSLSTTFTAISSRLYKAELWVFERQLTSTATVSITLADGSNTPKSNAWATQAANDYMTLSVLETFDGASGSTTRKGRAGTTAGTLSINPAAVGYHAPRLIVTDVGAA